MENMNISFETPNQPDVVSLIAELDAYLYSLYPADSVYALDIASLDRPDVLFAVARDGAGAALGCGAIMLTPEYGEIKRIYVRPAGRGQGLSHKLMDLLEGEAAKRGCTQFMLETGPDNPEALALYVKRGYTVRGPYGDYPDDPHSVFMEKAAQ
ncbi:GNAT family N-acetyltransferase [Pseudoduganella ginsengisoli]